MAKHCIRLTRGDDLFGSISDFCRREGISAGVILTGVGCVYCARLRDASGVTVKTLEKNMEIVSLTGTVSESRCHVHIALADESLAVYGGHLMPGTMVNTTAELVIEDIRGFVFQTEFDPSTGYDELIFLQR